jgi:hypothetical protein
MPHTWGNTFIMHQRSQSRAKNLVLSWRSIQQSTERIAKPFLTFLRCFLEQVRTPPVWLYRISLRLLHCILKLLWLHKQVHCPLFQFSAAYELFFAYCDTELDAVVGFKRLPTWKDRSKLPYMNSLLKEVQRWAPIANIGKLYSQTRKFFL